MKGDRELAGAEVGAEMAADLPDRVDDVGTHLLRDLLELLVVEVVEVGGAVDVVQSTESESLVRRLVWGISSFVPGEDVVGDPHSGRRSRRSAPASASLAFACDSAASWRARSRPKRLT